MADKPRTALVTGASRGIGRASALHLAKAGHRIAINYRSHGEEAEELKTEIESFGGTAITVKADVGVRSDVDEMMATTVEALGPIEILVNNAGIISDSLLVRMKDDDFERVMQTNVFGTYYCSKAVSRNMMRSRWGRIIMISSVVGLRGNKGQTNYSASKGAVNIFTKSLAKEMATRSVTVNAVAPGYIETATVNVLDQSLKDTLMTWIPMERFGQPDEIAGLVNFLASESASYITGEIIRADGGMAI